jgi:1A family penicillin-binding protein
MAQRITKSLVKRTEIAPHKKKPALRNLKHFLSKKNVKRALIFGPLAILLLIAFLFAWFARDLPSPNKVNSRNIAQSTKILDRDGDLLYELHGDKRRTLIGFDEMPKSIKEATIAIEDKNFYKHGAFDWQGIARAMYYDVTNKDKSQGGSTITQQFVKQALLSPEKTYTRKIKELILATEIEWMFSKNDILKMYLNEIPYGSNAYGIEAATQTYFGKHAKDLSLAESAALAALPQAPTYYSPFGAHTDDLFARKNRVLDKMAEQRYITKDQANAAKKEQLAFVPYQEQIQAPHFVMYVREELANRYGEKIATEGGLKVTTTLDSKKQKIAEEVVKEYGVSNVYDFGATNAALTSIDPKTGQILAMVGSRDYFNKEIDGNVNVTTRDRQPGSSFKPYVYATGFKEGYTPNTTLFDLNTNFGGGYEPKDYDLGQRGPVSARQALDNSLNIPAVKMLYLVGVPDALKTAHDMGITTLNQPDRYGLALVLGGGEVKLLDHTSAFSTFATEGIRHEKTPFLKIEDSKGKVLEEYKDKGEQALDTNVARAMNDVMSDNQARSLIFGTGTPLALSRPAAAKTGTTEEFRDAWTVGYTPNLTAGVWVGNNDNTPMSKGADGVFAAAPLWHAYMERALADMPVEDFNRSYTLRGSSSDKPIINGKIKSEGDKVKICTISGKRATASCPPSVVQEKEFHDYHCELFYIDKDNPLGPNPSNPAADPQYNNWEAPVRAKYGEETAPKEDCNIHTPENRPSISISSPSSGDTVNTTFTVNTSVSAPLGISKVEILLDGSSVIGTSYNSSVVCTTTSSGNHTITARITDQGAFTATSNSVSVSIADIMPKNVTADKIGLHTIRITWTAPSGSVDGYIVERKSTGSWSQISDTPATSVIDGAVDPGTTYYYRVRSYKGSTYSDYAYSNSVVAFLNLLTIFKLT